MPEEFIPFTLDELAAFDGKDGQPVYVAYKGRVFDVSGSKIWKTGRHMNRHDAGLDLTADLSQAPHGEDRLERYPQVGVVAGASATERKGGHNPQELPWLLRKSPFFRRHPHPMTVHFPIAFATGAVLCLFFYLVSGHPLFESAVHAMSMLGALFTPVAILTGLATWKYNYGASAILPVRVKLMLSPVLLGQFTACVVWWGMCPGVLADGGTGGALFSLLVLSMLPVMGVVGWFGAGLTFPMHE